MCRLYCIQQKVLMNRIEVVFIPIEEPVIPRFDEIFRYIDSNQFICIQFTD